jgi:hypothetical protein
MPELAPLVPVALIAVVLWAMTRYTAARLWHLLAGVVLGVILSGTVLGPDLITILSQLSGGRLHLRKAKTPMIRTLVLIGGAVFAVAWLVHQPSFAHDSPHKQAGALIAVTVPFLAADILLNIRKKRRARRRAGSPQAGTRARAGAGRW